MNRREFLIASAASVATIAFPRLVFSRMPPAKSRIVRVADDRFELLIDGPRSARILQLTDTHFGTPKDANRLTDELTRKLIRKLVDEQKPDLIFHTGDFINNDTAGVEHSAIGFMNDLGTPWSMVFGNHDHGVAQGSLPLNEYYSRFENHATGFYASKESGREYCFRIDVKHGKGDPIFSIIGFNCGSPLTKMVVTDTEIAWLRKQLETDAKAGHRHPILIMQHIPTIEFKTLYAEKAAVGRQGETVCFEQDLGSVFEMYRASGRVRGVFCGHDHVNDYIGAHKEVRLVYGRVTGWSGYGDWQRGGRVIDLDLANRSAKTRVVLPSGAIEKPEWSTTFKDAGLG